MQRRILSFAAGSLVFVALATAFGNSQAASLSKDDEWAYLGGGPESHQYSPLSQINSENIGRLGLLWYSDLPIPEGLIGNPLVKDGVVYQSGPWGRAVATDVVTGKTLWLFDPHLDLSHYTAAAAYIATVNRGLGMDEENVYIAAGCSLYAVDRKTGKQAWEAQICQPTDPLGANSSPRVGGGKVFVGVTNMQAGTDRGYAEAFDAKTGRRLWRFYTVPGDPKKPYEDPQMAMAAKTWGDHYWTASKGGGGVWEGMIYDPTTGLLIFGAGNPGVDGHEAEFAGKAMLFSDSLIAVDASTGKYVWHLQETTGDVMHPGDATAHMQLADLQINGTVRHVLMQAAKNGYFYLVDARTGKFISADEYGIPNTTFEPVDKETGTASYRKGLDFWNFPAGKEVIMQPGGFGGHTWELCSYDPDTGLDYIPGFVMPYGLTKDGRDEMVGFRAGARFKTHGLLIAYDPVTKEERWHVEHPVMINGGVLSTAGSLVIQGTPGTLYAYDARTGKTLWSYATHAVVLGAPSTVMVNGRQIILVPSGDGNSVGSAKTPELTQTSETFSAPSRLLAFALDARTILPPAPPKVIPKPARQRQPDDVASMGGALYAKLGCAQCHGENLMIHGNGRIPDLRTMPEPLYPMMPQILRAGLFRSLGMPVFPAVTDEQIKQLQAYIVNEAWKAYQNQGHIKKVMHTR
jgi:quinohemoprotein ethanol dehydrogenase